MKLPFRVLAASALVLAMSFRLLGQPSASEVKALVSENLAATQADDLDRIMATVHSESLSQGALPQAIEQLKGFKLRYEATKVEFISMAGEYALVRVVQETTRISGPAFLDNELDGIWALRQEDGKWKYWSQMVLTIKALERNPKP